MSKKERLLACYSDLQKSAVAYYLNPKGKTHQIFFHHAEQTLKRLSDKKIKWFLKEIQKIKKKMVSDQESVQNPLYLSDDLLTLGILLKNVQITF